MDIIQRICPGREEVARDNREYLRYLFKYILWFATNEVPVRADDETEESKNPGKMVSFIRSLSSDSSWKQIPHSKNSIKSSLRQEALIIPVKPVSTKLSK